jgi:SH3-like domain-containing protein
MGIGDSDIAAGGLKGRVAADHQASFGYGLVFYAGDKLGVEDRDTAWDGWTWCVDREGTGAWVPDHFIDRQGDSCVVLRDYDSTELTVKEGDALEVMEEANGWLWCVDQVGLRGWVPSACVDIEKPL